MATTLWRSPTDPRFRQRLAATQALTPPPPKPEPYYPPEITKQIYEKQKEEAGEREQYVAHNAQVIPVVNIKTGSQHFMVPESPEPIYYQEPVEQTLALKKMYRTLFVFTVIAQTALTLAQLLFWVEFVYTWPTDFIQDLITLEYPFIGGNVREITFCIVLHPMANAGVGMLAIFCFRDKCLHTYFLRCTLFCLFTILVVMFTIYFISIIPSINIIPMLEQGIDLYDLHNSTTIDDKWLAKAKHYHQGWEVVQQELKCCGIDHYNDWVSQRQSEVIKVPKSCCKAFRETVEHHTAKGNSHYDEDLDYCQKFPSRVNAWDEGCLQIFFDFVADICTGFVILQLLDAVLVVLSAVFAMMYYVSRKQEFDTDYDYPIAQYFIDCFCCTCCIKLKKKITDAELQQIKADHHWKVKAPVNRKLEDEVKVYHQHPHGIHKHRRDSPLVVVPINEVVERRRSRHSKFSRRESIKEDV